MYYIIRFYIALVFFVFFTGCEVLGLDKPGDMASSMPMTFGNSDNVRIVENHVMMFHNVVASETELGAELTGKIHVMSHKHYIPGHIDIAAIDNKNGEPVTIVSTDFNRHIAKIGHRNLNHANNIAVRLPDIDLSKVTIHVAYHYSNDMRLSEFDCGANMALSSIKESNSPMSTMQ